MPSTNPAGTQPAPGPPVESRGAAKPIRENARHPTNARGPWLAWLCEPPDLPADTNLKRAVDRVVPRRGAGYLLYWGAVVAIGFGLAPHLPLRSRLAVEGTASVLAGGWCALNFWRCRHAHCVVSGGGWLALSLLLFVEAAIGRSLVGGDEQVLFVGVLAAALAFECLWYRAHGTQRLESGL